VVLDGADPAREAVDLRLDFDQLDLAPLAGQLRVEKPVPVCHVDDGLDVLEDRVAVDLLRHEPLQLLERVLAVGRLFRMEELLQEPLEFLGRLVGELPGRGGLGRLAGVGFRLVPALHGLRLCQPLARERHQQQDAQECAHLMPPSANRVNGTCNPDSALS
jgi:hypothetical protein